VFGTILPGIVGVPSRRQTPGFNYHESYKSL